MSLAKTAAQALLLRLREHGVDYLFANGGTDFAPIIEAYADGATRALPMPEPLVIPHETAAMAMAHGRYLMTGKPQAVMVHVNVGPANTVMGVINAASDNVPILVMAGRTPITEHDRFGSRMTPIQYGQEMFDQAAMVREPAKWDYEMRYGEQAVGLVDRAIGIAMSAPRGPVYLGLPREPLAEPWPADAYLDKPTQAVATTAEPDRNAVASAAKMLAEAERPVVVCQRGDREGHLAHAVARLARDNAIPVVEFWPVRNVLAGDFPMHGGYDVAPWLEEADVVLAVDAQMPWIQRDVQLGDDTRVIHVAPDPLFSNLPVRSFRTDLAIAGDPAVTVTALVEDVEGYGIDRSSRFAEIEAAGMARRAKAEKTARAGGGSPMTPAFVSRCISDVMDRWTVLFTELGAAPAFMDLKHPHCCFPPPYAGGLGWGLPAALGASLADPSRLVIACVGDGSYTFANPVACHQIAEALELPVLTIVMNNGLWNAVRRSALAMYPDGKAAEMNQMPITSLAPTPSYTQIAAASRGWSERVETGEELPAALARAIEVIRTERRQALLEVMVSV